MAGRNRSSRAEYTERAKKQHAAAIWLLGKKEIREKISQELGDSTENMLFFAMCKSKLPVKGKSFEGERSEGAISTAAERLSHFLNRFSQQFQVLKEEGICLTIPRKVGHIQVGYYFSCFDRHLRTYLAPEDTENVLLRAWQQWKQPWGKGDVASFREHLYDFSDVIEDKTREFVGRKDVFDRIDRFVKANSSGYFFVRGDPGIGKSCVAASLVKDKGCVHHFNIRARRTGTTNIFLRNICSQLILTYGLDYSSLPPEAAANDRLLLQLLNEISAKIPASDKVIIVVDALDEAELDDSRSGNLLCLPPRLPENVFVVATCRNQEYPLRIEAPRKEYVIKYNSDDNKNDIRAHLQRKVHNRAIGAYVKTQELDKDAFVEVMVEKSQGNFMYLYYVLYEIEKGAYRDLEFERLPVGLEDYYEDHWRRMKMTASPPPALKLKIIYILCEVVEPVARALVAAVSSESEMAVQGVLTEWNQFLHMCHIDGEQRFSIYHESFRDFLHRREIVKAAGVDLPDINRMIGDHFFDELWGNE
jgi:hypothetical protein